MKWVTGFMIGAPIWLVIMLVLSTNGIAGPNQIAALSMGAYGVYLIGIAFMPSSKDIKHYVTKRTSKDKLDD